MYVSMFNTLVHRDDVLPLQEMWQQSLEAMKSSSMILRMCSYKNSQEFNWICSHFGHPSGFLQTNMTPETTNLTPVYSNILI